MIKVKQFAHILFWDPVFEVEGLFPVGDCIMERKG